ncbi:hypothetical protein [Streptomyces sp. NPDC001743]|uniref:hypothetical protein n=1 Tax=Streptomyces sp. NPDC001743 TaxID=3154397 RepID=UPI00331BB0C8
MGRHLKEAFGALKEQSEVGRASKRGKPAEFLPVTEDFTRHPLCQQTHDLLTCWQGRNYGSLSDLMTHDLQLKHGKSVCSEVRCTLEPFSLADFDIRAIRHDMAAAGPVLDILGHSGGQRVSAELRWVRENAHAHPTPAPMPRQWRLVSQRRAFLARPNPLPAE